jgi:hypothetical protein
LCLLIVGAVAIVAGAWIPLPPLIATGLWVVAILALVCLPLSPVRRAVARGLHLPKQPAQSLVRSGTSLTPDSILAVDVRGDRFESDAKSATEAIR